VHRGSACSKCEADIHPKLKLFNINNRTNLGSLMVSCENCGQIRSMQEAFVPEALASVYKCHGRRPWLEQDDYFPCSEKAVVRMRSSAGVYMAVNISALNIPPWSTNISKVLVNHLDAMDGKNDQALISYIQKKIMPYLPNASLPQIMASYKLLTTEQRADHPATTKELYEEEYCALREDAEDESADFCSRRLHPPEKYCALISGVSAVDRLTEIVAMVGFTRLQGWDGDLESPCLAPIFSRTQKEWLPAIDMHGEGIFIELNEAALSAWEERNEAVYRPLLERVAENHIHCENASARYVLLHTLSHLMIRALSKACGYQTSSLKERIYSSYPDGQAMAGILIYTASSDAEGSLGGLVAQATPDHMEEILDALLDDAEWCSGDPLCMESTGPNAQGLYGLNYAACHQCTLLPETSCAMRNILLDRAALVGRMDGDTNPTIGYFK
jgi:hypothetical protein